MSPLGDVRADEGDLVNFDFDLVGLVRCNLSLDVIILNKPIFDLALMLNSNFPSPSPY